MPGPGVFFIGISMLGLRGSKRVGWCRHTSLVVMRKAQGAYMFPVSDHSAKIEFQSHPLGSFYKCRFEFEIRTLL